MTQIRMPAHEERPSWLPLYSAQLGPDELRNGERRVEAHVEARREDTAAKADRRLTVLVAEDDPSIGWLVMDILEASGYRVALAYDGSSALALASSERPALVLTDRMMPDLGGIDLVRRLRADPATHAVPVALMSATRAGVTRNAVEHGQTDTLASTQYVEIDGELVPFLPKPFDLDELVGLVDALAREPDERRSTRPVSMH